jgi:hypothetical protein
MTRKTTNRITLIVLVLVGATAMYIPREDRRVRCRAERRAQHGREPGLI